MIFIKNLPVKHDVQRMRSLMGDQQIINFIVALVCIVVSQDMFYLSTKILIFSVFDYGCTILSSIFKQNHSWEMLKNLNFHLVCFLLYCITKMMLHFQKLLKFVYNLRLREVVKTVESCKEFYVPFTQLSPMMTV